MTARVDRSGRLTIPKAMRDATGLVPGTEVEIEAVDGVIVIRRSGATDDEPSCERLRGLITDGLASGEGRSATDDLVSKLGRQALAPPD